MNQVDYFRIFLAYRNMALAAGTNMYSSGLYGHHVLGWANDFVLLTRYE